MRDNILLIKLKDLLMEIGEEETKSLLSDFCLLGKGEKNDVESFLKEKSIIFENADQARTYLIFQNGRLPRLLAYFSLSNNCLELNTYISRKKLKELSGHHYFINRPLPAILIGQISKNYSSSACKGTLINGSEIIKTIFIILKEIYKLSPFRIIYLECKNENKLIDFLKKNGFQLLTDKTGSILTSKQGLLIFISNTSVFNNLP